MMIDACEAYGFEMPQGVIDIFTNIRKTHNQGVFDAYTSDMRAARKAGIITGLPDAYGRGRIIGDYRRVALYGVDFLIRNKKGELNALEVDVIDEDVIRLREELSEQIRALQELKQLGDMHGFDISLPATTAKKHSNGCTSVIWLRSKNRTVLRCHSDVYLLSWISTLNVTCKKVFCPKNRLRNWLTIL